MTASTQAPPQRTLFPKSADDGPDAVVVNDRVAMRTNALQRVVVVDGLPVHHYAVGDRAAEAYAMVNLVEAGFADQNDVARGFACSARTLRRHEARYDEGGIEALGRLPGRPEGTRARGKNGGRRDRVVRGMKAEGRSNCEIARRLGISEAAVRKRLKRSGWKAPDLQGHLFEDLARDPPVTTPAATSASGRPEVTVVTAVTASSVPTTADPLDRTIDRLFARLGLLDDAKPIFAASASVPRAGVLLAIPGLARSGVIEAARAIYGERALAPAFYGLRTTLVALVLLALLRIKRAEGLKEHAPPDLGRLLGLDRAPEVKTLRKKLALLAGQGGAERFGRELARRRVAERGRMLGFLYVDGHVRVYHGKHKIPKAHVAQLRLAVPGTTDYYVNDKRGEPLFVVTAEANAGMVKMLLQLAPVIRALVGEKRRPTIVFDRGGWSPALFAELIERDFDVLTYRKGRVEQIPERRFKEHEARIEGRVVTYSLHDKRVSLLDGKLRLRQVTRLTDGHQTPILTSRLDIKAIEVAYRMFERWRQENFFKYMRDEFAIDALTEHAVEPDDPTRTVPNPARRAIDKTLKVARAEEAKLAQEYGRAALDNPESERPTARGFKIAHGKLGRRLREARERASDLERQRAEIPERVTVADALGGAEVVKLAAQRQHLTTVLKMVAYQIESDLLALLHKKDYARVEDEGRTLVQTALQSAAALAPAEGRLGVTLAPLSSPHRSRAITVICEALNETATPFPGTSSVMRYAVADPLDAPTKADTLRGR